MPVYFIRVGDTGPVKIGYSGNVSVRLRGLQTSHVEALHVLRVVGGNQATERWLHKHFIALRLRGDWFQFDAEMLRIDPPEINRFTPQREPETGRLRRPLPPSIRCSVNNLCAECQALPPWERPYWLPRRDGPRRPPTVAE